MCVNFCVSNELYRAFFSWLSINHCQINHNHPSQQRKSWPGKKKKQTKNRQTTRHSGNTVTKPWLVLNLRLIGLVDGASILHQSQIRIQQKQGSGWFLFIFNQRLLQPTHIGAIIETWSNRQCISFVSPQSPIGWEKNSPLLLNQWEET